MGAWALALTLKGMRRSPCEGHHCVLPLRTRSAGDPLSLCQPFPSHAVYLREASPDFLVAMSLQQQEQAAAAVAAMAQGPAAVPLPPATAAGPTPSQTATDESMSEEEARMLRAAIEASRVDAESACHRVGGGGGGGTTPTRAHAPTPTLAPKPLARLQPLLVDA